MVVVGVIFTGNFFLYLFLSLSFSRKHYTDVQNEARDELVLVFCRPIRMHVNVHRSSSICGIFNNSRVTPYFNAHTITSRYRQIRPVRSNHVIFGFYFYFFRSYLSV